MSEFLVLEERGGVGMITLSRPKAMNALSLGMVRGIAGALRRWKDDPSIHAIAMRGSDKNGFFGNFCAGGDIRFFHEVALAGTPELEDFFTEEYALNYLTHHLGKPLIAFLDGIVFGGGMGLCQGATHRVVTERTKMAMPETLIGLFADVGGGYFLSRCPGAAGEWLAMTGQPIDAAQAIAIGLADWHIEATQQSAAWEAFSALDWSHANALDSWLQIYTEAAQPGPAYPDMPTWNLINRHFSQASVSDILQSLDADPQAWTQDTAAGLRKRSPLMLHVALEHVRRARSMSLAEDLRMERDMVRHCFHSLHLGRSGAATDTVEGIRALVIDKDQNPQWNPAQVKDVTPEMVQPFFQSPWPNFAHPLKDLA
jgi:enoyl-CoA hydratase/carnithine racemase